MASIFKIMRLDHALSEQDELDKQSLYLMGLTGTNQSQVVEQLLEGIQANTPQKVKRPFDFRAATTLEPSSTKEIIRS